MWPVKMTGEVKKVADQEAFLAGHCLVIVELFLF
jgi:hypothetical protein